jgi:hypothetical protein
MTQRTQKGKESAQRKTLPMIGVNPSSVWFAFAPFAFFALSRCSSV